MRRDGGRKEMNIKCGNNKASIFVMVHGGVTGSGK